MWRWLEKVIGTYDMSKPLVLTNEVKPKRARTSRGRYRGDDKSTADVNEAWVGGKAPRRKKKVYNIRGIRYTLNNRLKTR